MYISYNFSLNMIFTAATFTLKIPVFWTSLHIISLKRSSNFACTVDNVHRTS
jgi:hypothetical protein